MEGQNVLMISIVHYVWSYFMNLSQLLVGILFVARVYFSQWIGVSVLL